MPTTQHDIIEGRMQTYPAWKELEKERAILSKALEEHQKYKLDPSLNTKGYRDKMEEEFSLVRRLNDIWALMLVEKRKAILEIEREQRRPAMIRFRDDLSLLVQ